MYFYKAVGALIDVHENGNFPDREVHEAALHIEQQVGKIIFELLGNKDWSGPLASGPVLDPMSGPSILQVIMTRWSY